MQPRTVYSVPEFTESLARSPEPSVAMGSNDIAGFERGSLRNHTVSDHRTRRKAGDRTLHSAHLGHGAPRAFGMGSIFKRVHALIGFPELGLRRVIAVIEKTPSFGPGAAPNFTAKYLILGKNPSRPVGTFVAASSLTALLLIVGVQCAACCVGGGEVNVLKRFNRIVLVDVASESDFFRS